MTRDETKAVLNIIEDAVEKGQDHVKFSISDANLAEELINYLLELSDEDKVTRQLTKSGKFKIGFYFNDRFTID